jgi:hypothetical protein
VDDLFPEEVETIRTTSQSQLTTVVYTVMFITSKRVAMVAPSRALFLVTFRETQEQLRSRPTADTKPSGAILEAFTAGLRSGSLRLRSRYLALRALATVSRLAIRFIEYR